MSHILRVPGMPEHARVLLKQLLEEDPIPVGALPHIVESYRRVIHEAYDKHGVANVDVGDRIAEAAAGLLASITDQTPQKNIRIIQAAIRYFVIQEDADGHDLTTAHGLDDDARVMNAVLRFFGRDDLMIDIGDGAPQPPTALGARPAGPPVAGRNAPTRPVDSKAAKGRGGLRRLLRRTR